MIKKNINKYEWYRNEDVNVDEWWDKQLMIEEKNNNSYKSKSNINKVPNEKQSAKMVQSHK